MYEGVLREISPDMRHELPVSAPHSFTSACPQSQSEKRIVRLSCTPSKASLIRRYRSAVLDMRQSYTAGAGFWRLGQVPLGFVAGSPESGTQYEY